MESEDGMLPVLPTAACQGKDRWDLTPPTPTHRENERGTLTYIYTWDQPHKGTRYTTHNTPYRLIPFFLLLFSFLRTNSGIGVPLAHGSQGL